MKPEVESHLLARLFALCDARTTDMVPDEGGASVDRYFDPARLEAERARLFRRLPLLVGHAARVGEPGRFFTWEAAGVPLLIHRGSDGCLRGFVNVCRHRGTRVEPAAEGRAKAFVCPYHGWTYQETGRLAHVPSREGFPSLLDGPPVGLRPIAVEERLGFVWACVDPDGPSASDHLAPLEDELGALELGAQVPYRPESWRRALNWKLALEVFLETYHLRVAHRDSIYPMFFDNRGIVDAFGPHQRLIFPKRNVVELAGVPREPGQLRRHANLLYFLFPNTLVLLEPDFVSLVTVFPDGPDHALLHTVHLLPPGEPSSEKAQRHWDKNVDLLLGAVREDLALGESIQIGVHTGANQALRFGRFEHGLQRFHAAVDAALSSS